MSNREIVRYELLTNTAANGTSAKVAMIQDFRHIGLTVATSTTWTTLTVKVKGSRVEEASSVDFTTSASQSNPWTYLQATRNDDWTNIAWATWLVLSAISDWVYDLAINVDWFNWIAVEVSWYTAWDVSANLIAYNNQ